MTKVLPSLKGLRIVRKALTFSYRPRAIESF